MAESPPKIHLFWQRILFFFGITIRFLGRLFFLDMWRSPEARPVLAYMLAILVLGTVLFHWLEHWSLLDSVYFVVITLTTIGFGDFVPTSSPSKILTIFYGLNGIVLLLMAFRLIRKVRVSEFVDTTRELSQSDLPFIRKMSQKIGEALDEKNDEPPQVSDRGNLRTAMAMTGNTLKRLFLLDMLQDPESWGVLLYALVILLVGTLTFHLVEGWSFLNSVYFLVTAMTTIGYGDFIPHTSLGKVLTIFYSLNGIVVLLTLYDRIRVLRWGRKVNG